MIYIGEYFETVNEDQIKLPFNLKGKKNRILYLREKDDVYVIIHSFEHKNISEEYEAEVIFEESKDISDNLHLHNCFLEQLSDNEVVIYGVRDRIEVMSKKYASKLIETCDEDALSERISNLLNELGI